MTVRELYERLGRILESHERRRGSETDKRVLGCECRSELPVLVRQRRRGTDGRYLADHFAPLSCVGGAAMTVGPIGHFGLELVIDDAPKSARQLAAQQ